MEAYNDKYLYKLAFINNMPTIQERLQAIYARKRMQQQLAAQTSASRERRDQTQVTGRSNGMPKISTQIKATAHRRATYAAKKAQPAGQQGTAVPQKLSWWQRRKMAKQTKFKMQENVLKEIVPNLRKNIITMEGMQQEIKNLKSKTIEGKKRRIGFRFPWQED